MTVGDNGCGKHAMNLVGTNHQTLINNHLDQHSQLSYYHVFLLIKNVLIIHFCRFFTKQCADIYGPEFDDIFVDHSIKNSNVYYGGLKYNGTNVIFVNGKIDPWHAMSFFTQKPNPSTEIIYLQETAHCADMRSSRPTDSLEMQSARSQISTIIENWIHGKVSNSAKIIFSNVATTCNLILLVFFLVFN